MKLHANAALSLNERRVLCRRVVEEGWTVTEAAAAAEVGQEHVAQLRERQRPTLDDDRDAA